MTSQTISKSLLTRLSNFVKNSKTGYQTNLLMKTALSESRFLT